MRKKCRRKVWVKLNPIQHAIEGAGITPREMLNRLLMRELASLDAFTAGRARMDEWSDMVSVVSLAQELAGMEVGREALQDCHDAEQALNEAYRRYQETERMGLSGPGITALRNVIEWHDLQRASIPRSQYEEALRSAEARIKSGHATIDLEKTLGKAVA
jgi:hypothetical protein